MKVLSIRQPWAWLIVARPLKDIENRTWATRYRGEFLVHAGLSPDPKYREIQKQVLDQFGVEIPDWRSVSKGGIVGASQIDDCVTESESPWFTGPFGFELSNSRPLEFLELKGQLGLYDWKGLEKCDGNHAEIIPCLDSGCWHK